jgi:transposase
MVECIGNDTPSKSTIQRFLAHNSLKPHRSRYFLHITDPDFFPKMEHLVALFKNPPANLIFFDECPGIQILQRLTPDMQTEETKKRLEEFEYIRNGTLDVLAFLNYADGKIYAECRCDHKTDTFLEVFKRHVEKLAPSEEIHYVMDNLSSHRSYSFCQAVAELSTVPCPSEHALNTLSKRMQWLQTTDRRIIIHFTPFHGSWLNLVEIWFGIMGAKVLGESYKSAENFKAAFESFLIEWNCILAHPFRWSYDGLGLHQKAVIRFTKMLKNTIGQIDIRILTKMLMLMTNLLKDYMKEVENHVWTSFTVTLFAQYNTIKEMIQKEKGPKRKEKAQNALASMMAAIQ